MTRKKKFRPYSKKDRIEQEQTGPQAFGAAPYGRYIQYGNPHNTLSLKEIEEVRNFPTVDYCMSIMTIMGHSSQWTVEADEDVPWEAVNLVGKFVRECKTDVWRTGIYGWITQGYAAYEKVYRAEVSEAGSYRITIRKLKQLLPENIIINMDGELGFQGITVLMPRRVDLSPEKCLILTNEMQGDDLRGRAILDAVKIPAKGAKIALEGMLKYDEKFGSGPKYKITFPWGTSIDEHGVEVDNIVAARNFARELEDSRCALLPCRRNINPMQSNANQSDYNVEQFPQEAMNSTFRDDLRYLDLLIGRAFGFHDRAVFESVFGTKADAANGTDFLTLRIEYLVELMVDQLNKYVVDKLMEINYTGLAGRVKIKAGAIDKRDIQRISDLLTGIIASPYGQAVLVPNLDLESMMDTAEIPRIKQSETVGKTYEVPDGDKPSEGESTGVQDDVNAPPPASWEVLATEGGVA